MPQRTDYIIGAVVVVLVATGAGAAGYYIAKDKYELVTSDTQTPVVLTPDSQVPVLGGAVAGTATQIQHPDLMTYTSDAMHFSVEVPKDWKAQKLSNEVVFTTANQTRYSVQQYTASGSMDELQSFLVAKSNMHNVSRGMVQGYDVVSFDVDGYYKHGFAFVSKGRLYYIMGAGVENTTVYQTLRVL